MIPASITAGAVHQERRLRILTLLSEATECQRYVVVLALPGTDTYGSYASTTTWSNSPVSASTEPMEESSGRQTSTIGRKRKQPVTSERRHGCPTNLLTEPYTWLRPRSSWGLNDRPRWIAAARDRPRAAPGLAMRVDRQDVLRIAQSAPWGLSGNPHATR